jgi:nitrile hydratase accessory protein
MKVVAPQADANTADAIFAEPWEARAFALAVTLSGSERFSWDEFRDRLIAEIADGEGSATACAEHAAADPSPYYESWLAALEKILYAKAMLSPEEIERRATAIAASPPAPTKAQSHGPIKIA